MLSLGLLQRPLKSVERTLESRVLCTPYFDWRGRASKLRVGGRCRAPAAERLCSRRNGNNTTKYIGT